MGQAPPFQRPVAAIPRLRRQPFWAPSLDSDSMSSRAGDAGGGRRPLVATEAFREAVNSAAEV